MNRRRFTLTSLSALALMSGLLPSRGLAAGAGAAPSFSFPSIDGGTLNTADWRGRPVLVVNTASLCGFTPQLAGLQTLHETYGPRGLVVLAVPSDAFAQEYDDAKRVKEFCTIQYGITLPMTDILPVTGAQAHPFYRWLAETAGFVPKWNFNKVLLDPQGQVVATWGSFTKPSSARISDAFLPLLPRA
ncbi:glutathione peroxidase [Paracoccus jeotgali]|nr:glutathione peroxidase [Paracoccus jeotgali]